MANLSSATGTSALIGAFRALSDPTRFAVVERLSLGPAAVGDLARPFDMALPSFMQHLRVLEEAGLVETRKAGRVRTCTLRAEPLKAAQDWLDAQRAVWERRLDQLDSLVAELHRTGEGAAPDAGEDDAP